ncbi:gluconate 5-dehydrogenase, partial [Yersinia enterocolitica]|nr:gluconate 5-dehydrogenase [Yersinia enterocolitica]
MRDDFTASLRSACFRRCGHFVNNLSALRGAK